MNISIYLYLSIYLSTYLSIYIYISLSLSLCGTSQHTITFYLAYGMVYMFLCFRGIFLEPDSFNIAYLLFQTFPTAGGTGPLWIPVPTKLLGARG